MQSQRHPSSSPSNVMCFRLQKSADGQNLACSSVKFKCTHRPYNEASVCLSGLFISPGHVQAKCMSPLTSSCDLFNCRINIIFKYNFSPRAIPNQLRFWAIKEGGGRHTARRSVWLLFPLWKERLEDWGDGWWGRCSVLFRCNADSPVQGMLVMP